MSVDLQPGPGPAATITFAAPPVNVLTLELLAELESRFREAASSHPVVLLRSTGPNFSAGVDVAAHASDRAAAMLTRFHSLIRTVLSLPAIPVAAVQGKALGGALELLLAHDLVIASTDASLGQPEIEVGCFPPVATALLPERIGPQRAADMVYSGRLLQASEAADLGLVTHLSSPAGFDDAVAEVVEALCDRSHAVLRLARRALAAVRLQEWEQRIAACERIYLEELTRTDDIDEGVRAFAEKRAPQWRHR